MESRWLSRTNVILYLFVSIVLVACSKATGPPTLTSTATYPNGSDYPLPPGITAKASDAVYPQPAGTLEAPPTLSRYPAPEQDFITPTVNAYPQPGETQGFAGHSPAYPGPELVVPTQETQTPDSAYPGPQLDMTSTYALYPPPDGGSISTPSSTPGLQISFTPTSSPALGTPPFVTPSVSLFTEVPTITLTPTVVRIQLEASDPGAFNLSSGSYQLVEFFAFWSPTSKSMAPLMYTLEGKYTDRIQFVYLDIDDPANGLFATLLQNKLPPHFYLLDGEGLVLEEWHGYITEGEFTTVLDSLAP